MNNILYPTISIITVTYNAKKYLEDTIISVLNQEYKKIEYIIIDGASTDKTIDIIKKYEKNISYWLSEPDNGIYDAMNKGIDKATGEWVLFLNAGDTFFNNSSIKNFVHNVDKNTDLYNGSICFIDEQTNQPMYKIPHGLENIWKTIPCWHQASFIRTSLMKEYKYSLEYKIAGDHEFYLKCFINNKKFQFTQEVISNMLAGGIHQQENIRAKVESTKILFDYCNDSKVVTESNFFRFLQSSEEGINNFNFSNKFNTFFNTIANLSQKYSKIALYGYGTIGITIHFMIKEKISVIFDKNSHNLNKTYQNIQMPEDINNFAFDIIIITVLGREKEIKEILINSGIKDNKIITFNL